MAIRASTRWAIGTSTAMRWRQQQIAREDPVGWAAEHFEVSGLFRPVHRPAADDGIQPVGVFERGAKPLAGFAGE